MKGRQDRPTGARLTRDLNSAPRLARFAVSGQISFADQDKARPLSYTLGQGCIVIQAGGRIPPTNLTWRSHTVPADHPRHFPVQPSSSFPTPFTTNNRSTSSAIITHSTAHDSKPLPAILVSPQTSSVPAVMSTLRRRGPAPPRSYPCQGCGHPHNTRQGLAHHYSSKPDCRAERDRRELEDCLDSSNDEASDDDTQPNSRFSMGRSADSDSDDSTQPPQPPRKRTRVTVEDEVEDDVVETSIEEHPLGGTTFGRGTFPMDDLRDFQKNNGIPHTSPFPDEKEYLMYKWLLRAVPSLTEIDNGLKLDIVCSRVLLCLFSHSYDLSFR